MGDGCGARPGWVRGHRGVLGRGGRQSATSPAGKDIFFIDSGGIWTFKRHCTQTTDDSGEPGSGGERTRSRTCWRSRNVAQWRFFPPFPCLLRGLILGNKKRMAFPEEPSDNLIRGGGRQNATKVRAEVRQTFKQKLASAHHDLWPLHSRETFYSTLTRAGNV